MGAAFDNPIDLKLYIQSGTTTPTGTAGGTCGVVDSNKIVTCTTVPINSTSEGFSKIWAKVGVGAYTDTGETVYIEPMDYTYSGATFSFSPARGSTAPNYKTTNSSGDVAISLQNVTNIKNGLLTGNYNCKFDYAFIGTDSTTDVGWTTITGANAVPYTTNSCAATFTGTQRPANVLNFTIRVKVTGGASETYTYTSDYVYKISGVVS